MTRLSPLTSNLFAPLLIRMAIGFYLFLLGVWGFLEPQLSMQAVQRYAALPQLLVQFYGSIAPVLFFAIGVALMLGLFTRLTAVAASVLILPLLIGAGAFSMVPDQFHYFLEKRSVFRDVVILAGCFSLFPSGPGAFGIDRILADYYRGPKKN